MKIYRIFTINLVQSLVSKKIYRIFAIDFTIGHFMRQPLLILIALLLFACSLAMWQAVGCKEQRCESGDRIECSSENTCSEPSSPNNDCGQNNDAAPSCCWFCFGNCCYYVLPVNGFSLRSIPDEVAQKPDGLQNLFPQSFYSSVWHPPAAIVKMIRIPQSATSSNHSIFTT